MQEEKNKLVCLGDSTGTNYKLKVRNNTFSQLLGRRLGLEVCNFSKPSYNVGQMDSLLQSDEKLRADVKAAKVIVIALGGNNLMTTSGALLRMGKALGVTQAWRAASRIVEVFKSNPLKAAQMVKILNSDEARQDMEKAEAAFERDIPLLVEHIRELNEDAVILMLTLYTFSDISKSPVYKISTKTFTGITEKANTWIRNNYNVEGSEVIVADLARALRAYDGDEELSNLKNDDFHLSDAGHLFTYCLLYNSLIAAHPEYACDEGADVIQERKRKESKETVYSGLSSHSDELKKLIEDVTGQDLEDYDENKQFIDLGFNPIYMLDIVREVEKRYFNGDEVVMMNSTNVPYARPTFLLDYIDGTAKETVLKHLDEVKHYQSREEKAEAEKDDSDVMKAMKKVLYDYLQDDMVIINRDSTFFDSLNMSFYDYDRTVYLLEKTLDLSLLVAKRPSPETVTLGQIEDHIKTVVNPEVLAKLQ